MRTHFIKRPLRRRLIALATAYLIALSSLIASFGAATAAAAEVAGNTGAIICHADGGGLSSPTRDQTNHKICADYCSAGCQKLMTALPSPPASVALTFSTGAIAYSGAAVVIVAAFDVNSHRSRAPPLRA